MAITAKDLLDIWRSVVDPGFSEPLERLGDGNGIEAYGQAFAQLETLSAAVTASMQSLYVLPHSAQEAPPAMDGSTASVAMGATRVLRADVPLVLGAGQVWFEEQANDWGPSPGADGEQLPTGRLYTPAEDAVMMPGSVALTFGAVAEMVGSSWNFPAVGSISLIRQVGTGLQGIQGTIATEGANDYLEFGGEGDALGPAHVGQYLLLTAGANSGRVRRISAYEGGGAGRVVLERTVVFEGTITGNPGAGELMRQGARTVMVQGWSTSSSPHRLVGVDVSGGAYDGSTLTGDSSGATMAPSSAPPSPALVPEMASADWVLMRWDAQLGLSVANVEKPSGGAMPVLDALGAERNVPRATGEPDSSYRQRVATMPDTVSPNAVRRAINRSLLPYGVSGCLREVGTEKLPGFYLDHDALDVDAVGIDGTDLVTTLPALGFRSGEKVKQVNPTTGQVATGIALCVDMTPFVPPGPTLDCIANVSGKFVDSLPIETCRSIYDPDPYISFTPRPGHVGPGLQDGDRYRYLFGDSETRAFFLVGVPALPLGEFGFAWDEGAFDMLGIASGFLDGYPWGQTSVNRAAWQAADTARAAGVRFDLVQDPGCA